MDITTKIVTVIVYLLIFLALYSLFKFIYSYFTMQHRMKSSDYDDELLNESLNESNWIETMGTFTGKKRHVVTRSFKLLVPKKEYYEYEIVYNTEQGKKSVWYQFYPVPEPLDDFEGVVVKLKYNVKKPWIIKIVDLYPEESE